MFLASLILFPTLAPAVVDHHHFTCTPDLIGYNEAHLGEKLIIVLLDLAHHPAVLLPGNGSVVKLEVLDLEP